MTLTRDEAAAGTTRPPRVLVVENALHWTGSFSSALSIAEALRETHEVQLLLPSASTLHARVREHGISCRALPMSEIGRSWRKLAMYVPLLFLNGVRLRRLLATSGTDILVLNDYYNLLGAVVKLLGWRGTLLTMVRLMPADQHAILNRIWSCIAIACSTRVLAVSNAVASQLPPHPAVTVVYNPICFQEQHPPSIERMTGPGDEVRCLYLANYIDGKGHEDALEAFAAAYRVNRTLRLSFIGNDMGLAKNRALKDSLARRTKHLGLQGVVQVRGGTSDPEWEIKGCDILLNFSHTESFSHTCVEGSAFGRPVVATRCGGPAEIVADGLTGVLVGVRDREAMADAILRLAADAAERRRMGQMGRDFVRQRFSCSAFVRSFEKVTCPDQEPVC